MGSCEEDLAFHCHVLAWIAVLPEVVDSSMNDYVVFIFLTSGCKLCLVHFWHHVWTFKKRIGSVTSMIKHSLVMPHAYEMPICDTQTMQTCFTWQAAHATKSRNISSVRTCQQQASIKSFSLIAPLSSWPGLRCIFHARKPVSFKSATLKFCTELRRNYKSVCCIDQKYNVQNCAGAVKGCLLGRPQKTLFLFCVCFQVTNRTMLYTDDGKMFRCVGYTVNPSFELEAAVELQVNCKFANSSWNAGRWWS